MFKRVVLASAYHFLELDVVERDFGWEVDVHVSQEANTTNCELEHLFTLVVDGERSHV